MSTTLPDDGLPSTIARIDGVLSSEQYSTGDRAALRRMAPGQPIPLAFYRFALGFLADEWDRDADTKANWAAIVAGMAVMSPGAHRVDWPLGRALAEAYYSETRLERLLSAEGDTARALVLRTARFLAAKGTPCNWVDLACLLLTQQDEKRDNLTLRVARAFYSHPSRKDSH